MKLGGIGRTRIRRTESNVSVSLSQRERDKVRGNKVQAFHRSPKVDVHGTNGSGSSTVWRIIVSFPLTPALSPGERENHSPFRVTRLG
jgi:hypothetical protein